MINNGSGDCNRIEGRFLPDGMLRTKLPADDERVVRELLVNALVHRSYTQRGDIFINLHSDRFEKAGVLKDTAVWLQHARPSSLLQALKDLRFELNSADNTPEVYQASAPNRRRRAGVSLALNSRKRLRRNSDHLIENFTTEKMSFAL